MCGRIRVYHDLDDLRARFGLAGAPASCPAESCPGQPILAIGGPKDDRVAWLADSWGVPLERSRFGSVAFARIESSDSPMWAPLYHGGRALIPATTWWERGIQIKAAGKDLDTIAALACKIGERSHIVVVTVPASPTMVNLTHHPRMPLVIPIGDRERWLDEADPADVVRYFSNAARVAA